MRNGRLLGGNQKNNKRVQDLDAYEYAEEGFSEGVVVKGNTVASFSFASPDVSSQALAIGTVSCSDSASASIKSSDYDRALPSKIAPESTSSIESGTASGLKEDFDSKPALSSSKVLSDRSKSFSFSESVDSPYCHPVQEGIKANGQTPAVDGELFSIKRGYQFRPSTIRKLHEMKAAHPDVNVYLNTIIDDAILFYYKHKMSEIKKNT